MKPVGGSIKTKVLEWLHCVSVVWVLCECCDSATHAQKDGVGSSRGSLKKIAEDKTSPQCTSKDQHILAPITTRHQISYLIVDGIWSTHTPLASLKELLIL